MNLVIINILAWLSVERSNNSLDNEDSYKLTSKPYMTFQTKFASTKRLDWRIRLDWKGFDWKGAVWKGLDWKRLELKGLYW